MMQWRWKALPITLALVLTAPASLFSQTTPQSSGDPQTLVSIEPEEVEAHRIGKLEPITIHLVGGPEEMRNTGGTIPVEVTVGPDGAVISASVDGEDDPPDDDVPKEWIPEFKRVIAEAKQQVRSLHYRPFERDGRAVTATFEEQVPCIPPEMKPGPHVDFPEVKNWKSLVMSLERTGCFGSCPSYQPSRTAMAASSPSW